MSKYYAVRVGKVPGIYEDWSTTSKQVTGFPGAIHKSFKTLDDAKIYMNGIENYYMGVNNTPKPTTKLTATSNTIVSKSSNLSNKYYVVISGHNPGIYSTWIECQSSIKGYSGAIYKSFNSREEAEAMWNKALKFILPSNTLRHSDEYTAIIYTDGSGLSNGCGFGVVALIGEDKYAVYGQVPKQYGHTNNVAELYALYMALYIFQTEDNTKVIIYSDSMYSIYMATVAILEQDTTNITLIKEIREILDTRKCNYKFQHVDAHCGIQYNEECDVLAKRGATNNEELVIYKNNHLYSP